MDMRTSRFVTRDAKRGVVLLIITLILAALSLSGAALLILMRAEREATDTRGLEGLVKGADRSAVVFLIAATESTPTERERFGGLYDNPKYFCNATLLSLDEGGDDSSHFTVVSPKFTDSKIEGIRYGLVDESTKLNLDAVLAWDVESPGAGREALMKLPGMTAIAADSILDWIDPDERPRQNGAEASYYASKKLPYSPRNAVPVFLEEILLARGASRSQLYGSDENFTYGAESYEPESENALGGSLDLSGALETRRETNAAAPWKELLTVFSAEKDVDPSGEARVDLNGDDLQFLYDELNARVGADLAKFIALYRQYGPQETTAPTQAGNRRATTQRTNRASGYTFRGAQTNANAPNGAAAPTVGSLNSVQIDFSRQPTTKLATPLDVVGARVVVNDVAYDSPLSASTSSQNEEAIFKFLDYCSTSPSTTIVGRVNINAAPRIVLSAIPGLSAADAQNILSKRPDPSQSIPNDYRHATWLYTKGLVSLERMRELYNKTTARGDVFRGQVIGFLDSSDEKARAEVVIDGTTIPPRQVYYKDLTTLGKGFSTNVLLGGSNARNDGDVFYDESSVSLNSDLFEIESPRESGYSFGSSVDDFQSADPFAAVNEQLGISDASATNFGSTNVGANATNANAPSLTGDANVVDPFAAVISSDASNASNASSAIGATSSQTTQSRRERMTNTLNAAREQRRARYDEATNANTATPNETTDAVAPTPDAIAGGGFNPNANATSRGASDADANAGRAPSNDARGGERASNANRGGANAERGDGNANRGDANAQRRGGRGN